MEQKLLKDITYPEYPQAIEVRAINKWYTHGNNQQFSYLFVDRTGYAIEAQANSTDEDQLDRMITIQHCYIITNYTTVPRRNYTAVVPHPVAIKLAQRTCFQPLQNEEIPTYFFNFVTMDELQQRLARLSPLSDFIERAESITDMIPTKERGIGRIIHLRRVIIMDERARSIEVTLWEEKGREIDKNAALYQIVAVTATYASKYLDDIKLTSTNATKFFIDPPLADLEDIKERFSSLPHTRSFIPQNHTPTEAMEKITVSDPQSKKTPAHMRTQFSCEATITGIFAYRSWFYKGCQYCPQGVNQQFDENGEIMWNCDTHEIMKKPRHMYVLNTVITDHTGSTEAIFFNNVVQQLTGISCEELVATNNYRDPKTLPNEIKQLQGRRDTLQLSIKMDGNINVNKILDP